MSQLRLLFAGHVVGSLGATMVPSICEHIRSKFALQNQQ
jgi:calcineurin-like phosphoesterase